MHVNVLARLFRGKMLAMLSDAHAAGQLMFFNSHADLADKKAFKRFLAPPLRHIKCVIYCKSPFAGPKQVRYLTRYTHRVAISKARRRQRAWLLSSGSSIKRCINCQSRVIHVLMTGKKSVALE